MPRLCWSSAIEADVTEVTLDAFRFDLAITKRKLELRRAWQIGPHDPDMSALRIDDDPIIPAWVRRL